MCHRLELVTLVARISLGLNTNEWLTELLCHCALGELELPAPAPVLTLC